MVSGAVPPAHPPAAPGVPGPSPAVASLRHAASAVAPVVPAPASPVPAAAAAPVKGLTLREVNAARITFVVSRIASFLKGGCRGDPSYLVQPCYTLARGIDFSVTAGEVYANAHELPPLVKQVYKFRSEPSLKAAIMVLLISVKNACRKGWFQAAESNELIAMANEMSNNFCFGSRTSEENKALSVISIIMPRFYPQMKLGSLLVSLEAKPGYDVLVTDFIIPRNMPPQEKIRLFVAQTDNMETSFCLISPPQVNFLINGRGVERRTTGSVDVGPQFPTDITKMLKYGTNLIQAVGFFGGNYAIAIAFMSTITSSGIPVLQDYVQPTVATVAQDAEIIEGPSKISLNCPISFRRIKAPVKGHHCKHHQCFDYENFMAMNARKPSWRCPHCNQPVSCVDIRIDQNMVKILAETGENVTHVVISADGSWEVVEHDGSADKLHGMLRGDRDDSIGCEPSGPSNSSFDVVDLTMEEDTQADVFANLTQIESLNGLANQSGNSSTCDPEETKPFQDIFQGFSVSEFISAAQPAVFNSEAIPVTHSQVRNDLQSRNSLATTTSVVPGNVSWPYSQMVGAGLHPQNPYLDPVITDAVSPTLNREDADNFLLPTSAIQISSQTRQFMDNLQLQQTHFGNSIVTNGPERQPIPRHVNRTPIAIQGLPAQPQIPSLHQRPPSTALSLTSVPSISVQASLSVLVNQDEINPANTGIGRQQLSGIPNLASTQLHSGIQNEDPQSCQYPSLNPVPQHVMGLPAQNPPNLRPPPPPPNQQRGGAAGGSLGVPASAGGPSPHQQHLNSMWAQQQARGQATSNPPQPYRFPSLPGQHATTQGAAAVVINTVAAGGPVSHNPVMATQSGGVLLPAMQASRTPPFQAPSSGDHFRLAAAPGGEQVRGVGRGGAAAEAPGPSTGFGDAAVEQQGWRPTGRMRGSLTGSAYAAALSHYLIQPTHAPSSSRPASADQNRAVASEPHSPLPNGGSSTTANGSLVTEQPRLGDEDPGGGGPLRV